MASPKIKKIEVGDKTRYRFVVDIGADPKTGKRKQLTKTFDKLKEAQTELAKILNETNKGTYAAPSKLTVNEYLDTWLRSATRGKEANTVANYRNSLKPVREQLGATPLQKLTTVDVEDLVDYMLTSGRKRGGKVGTGLSARSVQLTLSRLRSALDSAVHRRLVEFNVAAPVKAPTQKRTQAVMLLSLMGLRPAEVCGLRWSDVDLGGETVHVGDNTRTIVWGEDGGKVDEKGAKTEAGKRPLPLLPAVVAALKRFKALQAKEKLAAGPAYVDSGYVLVDELGEPCRTDWLRRRAYKLIETAKVRKVRLYDARHACLTYLATNGVPDVIVSAWAGHADLSIAKRVYVHPSAKDLEQGRDALAKLLG